MAKAHTVKTRIGRGETASEPVTVEYAFPETLAEAGDMYGEEIALAHMTGSVRVALQGFVRSRMEAGDSPQEIQEKVNTWQPSQRTQGKSQEEKAREFLSKLDPETRAALLADFKGKK